MHLLGRDMPCRSSSPTAASQDLIKIADWDFDWQNTYYFEKPLDLPKGSVVKVVAHYDNSGEQPPQPQPARQARQVGRGDHRRDVHRLHRRHQEGPGPHPARREG